MTKICFGTTIRAKTTMVQTQIEATGKLTLTQADWARAYAARLLKDWNDYDPRSILVLLLLAPEERNLADFQEEVSASFQLPLDRSFKARITRALTAIERACTGLISRQSGTIGLNKARLHELKLSEEGESMARTGALRSGIERERVKRGQAVRALLATWTRDHSLDIIEVMDLQYHLENPESPSINGHGLSYSSSLKKACGKLPQAWFVGGVEERTFAPTVLAALPPLINERNATEHFELPNGPYPLEVLQPFQVPKAVPKPKPAPEPQLQRSFEGHLLTSVQDAVQAGYLICYPHVMTLYEIWREARLDRLIEAHKIQTQGLNKAKRRNPLKL